MNNHPGCSTRVILCHAAVLLALSLSARASEWQQRAVLTAPDARPNANFGRGIRISGDYAVIGSPDGAYVLKREGSDWVHQTKLTAPDLALTLGCIGNVGISGDSVIVGADSASDYGQESGAAYVFAPGGGAWVSGTWVPIWIQQARLTPPSGAAFDKFGYSVSISGDCAIVGAPFEDGSAGNSGAAYVFHRAGGVWALQAKLTAADAAENDNFGTVVCLEGDHAIVAAPFDDAHPLSQDDAGSAYVFRRSGTTWAQEAKLMPVSEIDTSFDHFPSDICISGDRVILGTAYYYAGGGVITHTSGLSSRGAIAMATYHGSGSAYIFRRDGTDWTQEAELRPSDEAGDAFGWTVSLSGDYAVVGAIDDNDNGASSGSAYVFKRDGTSWTQDAKVMASEGAEMDEFGMGLALRGDSFLVGAQRGGANDAGAVYVFSCKVPVHRFWSASLGRHFYTSRESEKAKLISTYGRVWAYEDVAYQAYTVPFDGGLAPVYRFWSEALSGHFYTISERERDKLIRDYASVWAYEGIAFYAYPVGAQPPGAKPVYRFWSSRLSGHFFTVDAAERDKLISRFSDVWTYEKIAWYAPE